MNESKRNRFVTVAEKRTQKVIDALALLAKCSNLAVYEYDEKDLKKIFGALDKAMQEAKDRLNGKQKFTLR